LQQPGIDLKEAKPAMLVAAREMAENLEGSHRCFAWLVAAPGSPFQAKILCTDQSPPTVPRS
jgi:hypothetical protein